MLEDELGDRGRRALSPGTRAGVWKCAMSMATPAAPDNATQILVARLDTDGHSFLACWWVPDGCRGLCRAGAGPGELDVPGAAGRRVIAGLRRARR